MIKFFKNDRFSNAGDKVHVLYKPVVNDDGSIDLVEAGKEDINAYIQSFAESCDLECILAKYAAGDTSVLSVKKPMFGDFTKMPSTYAEVLQLQIDSANLFNSLPVDIKKQFDNDPNKFLAAAGTNEWIEKISPILPEYKKESEKEVVSEDTSLKE